MPFPSPTLPLPTDFFKSEIPGVSISTQDCGKMQTRAVGALASRPRLVSQTAALMAFHSSLLRISSKHSQPSKSDTTLLVTKTMFMNKLMMTQPSNTTTSLSLTPPTKSTSWLNSTIPECTLADAKAPLYKPMGQCNFTEVMEFNFQQA